MAQNHRTLPSSLSTSAIRHNLQRIEKNVRQQNNWDFCLGISVWGATYVKHGLPQSNSHSQAGHRPHSIIHPAVPPSWTGPSPCLLCFLPSSASAWARSAPVPPRRQPPAPPTAQSCGGTSKSGQVSNASSSSSITCQSSSILFLASPCCRCRGSPVLVVLQEPAEDVDADEAMADSPLAAGWPRTHHHSILEL